MKWNGWIKALTVFALAGAVSPEITWQAPRSVPNMQDGVGIGEWRLSVLHKAEARRGGGMRMRGGGMRMRSGGFNRGGSFNRMRAPSRSRYQGGNFYKSKRPISTRPVSTRPTTRPVGKPQRPTTKPVHRPNRPGNGRPPHGPGNGRPPHGPGHGHPPHHGHHHHHHHYPYHGWGGYWPWFWGSAIVVGAVVSTIPENDCRDVKIDGKFYKECEGVLFEPVYRGDDVEYKVVEIKKK